MKALRKGLGENRETGRIYTAQEDGRSRRGSAKKEHLTLQPNKVYISKQVERWRSLLIPGGGHREKTVDMSTVLIVPNLIILSKGEEGAR